MHACINLMLWMSMLYIIRLYGNRNAWICTEIRSWAGTSRKHLFPKGPNDIFFLLSAHTDPKVQLSYYLIVSASSVTGQKRRGFDADQSALYSADVKDDRSCTAGPTVSHGVHTDILKFTITIKGHINERATDLLLERSSAPEFPGPYFKWR